MTDLNKQIAEKLGWIKTRYQDNPASAYYEVPGETETKLLPAFTHSLDACVKYIVPWLVKKGLSHLEFCFFKETTQCQLWFIVSGESVREMADGFGETEALALCKAFMEV